jgi:hypothetical protein
MMRSVEIALYFASQSPSIACAFVTLNRIPIVSQVPAAFYAGHA